MALRNDPVFVNGELEDWHAEWLVQGDGYTEKQHVFVRRLGDRAYMVLSNFAGEDVDISLVGLKGKYMASGVQLGAEDSLSTTAGKVRVPARDTVIIALDLL